MKRIMRSTDADIQVQLQQGVLRKCKSWCPATHHQLGHGRLTLLLPCCLLHLLMQTPQPHFKDIKKITLFDMLQTKRFRRHTKADV